MDGQTSREELDARSAASLEAAMYWLISEASGRLFSEPGYASEVSHEIMRRHRVSMYARPQVTEGTNRIRYIIKSRGIYYDTTILASADHGGDLYEYWLLKISTREWASPRRGGRFIVTKAPGLGAQRTIVRQSETFFDQYEVRGSVVLKLDLDDIALRYNLRAAHFRALYPDDPELTGEDIVFEGGSYQSRPVGSV